MEVVLEPTLLVGQYFVGFIDHSACKVVYWKSAVVSSLFLSG